MSFVVCALLAGGLLCLPCHAGDPKRGPMVGGPVRYKKYPGTAVITRVEKTAAANARKANATEGYEVWYKFTPKGGVPQEARQYPEQHKEHQFVLGSSEWRPGPKFIKKYGIEKRKEFAATLLVEVQGTATPILIKLDAVPGDDNFEAADQSP
jgi:hypothetical protein